MWMGNPLPVIHNQLLCLADIEGEVAVPAPHCQVTDLLPPLIVVGDQALHRCVVSKDNDCVGDVYGHTVVGEQGVQEVTMHAPLREPHVEGQRC